MQMNFVAKTLNTKRYYIYMYDIIVIDVMPSCIDKMKVRNAPLLIEN